MAQNNLDIIINSPDKMLLAERRILEKKLEEIKKPPLQPKELFPSLYTGPFQVVNSAVVVDSLALQMSLVQATMTKVREVMASDILVI